MNHPQIAAFARLAKENSSPTRVLQGQKTLLSRTMHDLGYDAIHDEIVVTSPLAQAILVYRGAASGEEPPLRVIQGPHTQILGSDYEALSKVSVDPVHNEILLPNGSDSILVFPREANGDVAPVRVISGPDTQLRYARIGGFSLAVDPVHDLLVASRSERSENMEGDERGRSQGPNGPSGSLLIFNRTADGNAKPQAVIHGPKTGIGRGNIGQMQVYTPKGWIVANAGGSIGVWSIHDNGDVAPRWTIASRKDGYAPRGLALNPKDKELYVADNNLNAVMTFYFPEIF